MILALDAGGSSTRALLLRADGGVLAAGSGGPANHILSGWESARRSIGEAIGQACAAGGAAGGRIALVVVGSAGVGPQGEGSEVIEGLLNELVPGARAKATGDMVTALGGALRSSFGVVVAAGTGSVCYGRNPQGAGRQVGGWGPVMGDEGSAYDIAVRALRAGAQATDGRGPRTTLCQRLPAALQVSDFIGVAIRVYGEPMSRDAIARLATVVTTAAAAGDAVAREVLDQAGEALAAAAVAALRALDLADRPTPVAYTGAVFDAGELVTGPFRRALTSACPGATIVAAEFPPVIGAFKLALQEMGCAFSDEVAARLRATMEVGRP